MLSIISTIVPSRWTQRNKWPDSRRHRAAVIRHGADGVDDLACAAAPAQPAKHATGGVEAMVNSG